MSEGLKTYRIHTLFRRNVSAFFVGLGLLYAGTFVVLWTYGSWSQITLAIFLAPALIWLSVHDLQTFEIPDIGTLIVAITGFVHITIMDQQAILIHTATAVGITAFFWLIGDVYYRCADQEGLGIGDAKLFGAGALIVGPWQIPELILLSSLGGIMCHLLCQVRRQEVNPGIPFGPFIAYTILTLSFLDPIFL